MQLIAGDAGRFVFNAARGEELLGALLAWCEARGIEAATLAGLGACDRVELAYYRLAAKTYERHLVEEELEILSLAGNLAFLGGERALHIHGVFGRSDLSTLGGHVMNLRVSGACEIYLIALPAAMRRERDEETGLNLLRGADI